MDRSSPFLVLLKIATTAWEITALPLGHTTSVRGSAKEIGAGGIVWGLSLWATS